MQDVATDRDEDHGVLTSKPVLLTVPVVEQSQLAALEQRVAELTAALAARDSFLAVAAHELRNPMTPIIGHIDLLMSAVNAGRASPERVRQGLERIHSSVRRFMRRADVLLEVSRFTSGKTQIVLEPFDLSALLRDMTNEFAGPARLAGVSITLTVPDSLPGTWDCLAMEQIIDNLISNALKYGDRTPVEISAAICGQQVRIQVRDYGRGVLACDRGRVFGQFETGRRDVGGGFGVGLWVVRRLVEAMNGAVTVDDAPSPGGGALFTVILPRHVMADAL